MGAGDTVERIKGWDIIEHGGGVYVIKEKRGELRPEIQLFPEELARFLKRNPQLRVTALAPLFWSGGQNTPIGYVICTEEKYPNREENC